MSFALLPEFFAFLGVDVFVAMSLLTCLLDDYFPKTLPYVFQAAAIGGYVHLLISKDFLVVFGDAMRFWYCFLYLAVALANIIALNVYLAVIKKHWTLAKVFSGAVVFPALLISGFFVSDYASQVAGVYLFQVAMLFSALVLGLSIAVLLSSRIMGRSLKRR
jgi:hypothetical protein